MKKARLYKTFKKSVVLMFKFRLLLRSQLPHRGKRDYGALIRFTFFIFHMTAVKSFLHPNGDMQHFT